MHKVKTNVKPIRRKPAVHVSMAGYTPAEEKVMQERKIALIEQHNAQLEAIKNHTDKTAQHVERLIGAFHAFTEVIGAFIGAQKVPAKTRAAKTPAVEQAQKDFKPEPEGTPSAGVAGQPTPGAPSRIHAVRDPGEGLPPPPEGLIHEDVKRQHSVEKPTPTVDTLRSALLDFIAKNGRGAGEEKLAAFKAKKITDIPQADWAAFAASLG